MIVELDLVKRSCPTGAAVFSKDSRYRYQLTRSWATGGEYIVWIMLNPSTADATENDPTIRRCIAFSQGFGACSLLVVNLFALRATDPKELLKKPEKSVGSDNVRILTESLQRATRVVAAWGAISKKLQIAAGPSMEVIRKIEKLHCLGKTQNGSPRHPLYVSGDSPLVPWSCN